MNAIGNLLSGKGKKATPKPATEAEVKELESRVTALKERHTADAASLKAADDRLYQLKNPTPDPDQKHWDRPGDRSIEIAQLERAIVRMKGPLDILALDLKEAEEELARAASEIGLPRYEAKHAELRSACAEWEAAVKAVDQKILEAANAASGLFALQRNVLRLGIETSNLIDEFKIPKEHRHPEIRRTTFQFDSQRAAASFSGGHPQFMADRTKWLKVNGKLAGYSTSLASFASVPFAPGPPPPPPTRAPEIPRAAPFLGLSPHDHPHSET